MGFALGWMLSGSRSISLTEYFDKSYPERGTTRGSLKLQSVKNQQLLILARIKKCLVMFVDGTVPTFCVCLNMVIQ